MIVWSSSVSTGTDGVDMAEELEFNLLYSALLDNHYDKLQEAQEKHCVICIPRNKYLSGISVTLELIKSHILIPSPYFKDVYFTYFNYASRLYKIKNNLIERVTINKNEQVREEITVLQREVSYNKDLKPYSIIVIDGILSVSRTKMLRTKPCCPSNITTLVEASRFMRSLPDATIMFKKLDNKIEYVLRSSDEHFLFANIHLLLDEELAEIEHLHIDKPCPRFHKIAALALECYLSAKTYHHIFPIVSKQCGVQDLHLWEQTIKQSHNEKFLKDLGLNMERLSLEKPIKIMKQMKDMKHHVDILRGMKKIISMLSSNNSDLITSDDLLATLVALFCKVKLHNLASLISYTNRMMWRMSQYDSLNFALVTFQAASDILNGSSNY